MTIYEAISRGDVVRDVFPDSRIPGGGGLPLYLGSGSSGACFDGYGLMDDNVHFKLSQDGRRTIPATALRLRHADHYYHGDYGIDLWAPFLRLKWADDPELKPGAPYSQKLALYSGLLTTSYTLEDGTAVTVRNSFNPKRRDVLAVSFAYDGRLPELRIVPETETDSSYGQKLRFTAAPTARGFAVDTGTVTTELSLRIIGADCRADSCGDGSMTVRFPDGRHSCTLLLGVCSSSRADGLRAALDAVPSADAYFEECREAWAWRYGDAYLEIPDDYCAKMWARSLYYVLCSFAPNVEGMPAAIPSAPMGWSGYGWNFHFPQDISYIHPALLRLGHFDLAKSIVEFYRSTLDSMKRISARIYGGRGVMWAWEYPISDKDDLLTGEAPNVYQFEIHNAAYPARMAYETALYLKDDRWTKEVALPIIRESAEFYASHLIREENGRMSLHVIPSMSQDEFASPDSKNYLCSLYSARYAFTVAVKCGMTEYEPYLQAGLSFDRLYDPEMGLYRTSEQMTAENWGAEKHPVQLNPLVFLPVGYLSDTERRAYEKRADICAATKRDFFHGWTLATFWLSASHMGDGEGMLAELHRGATPGYTDCEELQFNETTQDPAERASAAAYYVTTHGFYLQAVCDAFVTDFFGVTELCRALPPAWKGAKYHNLHTRDGVYSG